MSTGKVLLILVGGYIAYEYFVRGVDVFGNLFGHTGAGVAPGAQPGTGASTSAETGASTNTSTNPVAQSPAAFAAAPYSPPATAAATNPLVPVAGQKMNFGTGEITSALVAAATADGHGAASLTWDQWNWYYARVWGAGSGLAPAQGIETRVTPMTALQFLQGSTGTQGAGGIISGAVVDSGGGVTTFSPTGRTGSGGVRGLRGGIAVYAPIPQKGWTM